MSLGELGYHPAYQPGPGETHYVDHSMSREYTTAENIAGAALVATLIAPGAVIGGVGLTGRVLWSLSQRFAARAILVGPFEQMARHKTLDTYINRADFVYTAGQYMRHRNLMSPGNSSQVLPAGSARPGGTYKIPGSPSKFTGAFKDGHNDKWRGVTNEWIRNPCRKGFRPDKIKGAWVCRRGSWSSYIKDIKAGRL